MSEKQGSRASPFAGLLAIFVLVAIVGLGVFAYSGGFSPQRTADVEINVPDIDLPEPDIDLPERPPAPQMPPRA
jgi:hypothetical protein